MRCHWVGRCGLLQPFATGKTVPTRSQGKTEAVQGTTGAVRTTFVEPELRTHWPTLLASVLQASVVAPEMGTA